MFAYWVLFLSAFLVFQVVAGLFAIWAIKYMSKRDMAEFAARRDPVKAATPINVDE